MAEDQVIDVAEAIVTALNAVTTWSIPFQATRTYNPVYKREESKPLVVCVMAKSDDDSETLSRRVTVSHEIRVDIGVMKDVAPNDLDECDAMIRLVREIKDELRNVNMGNSTWMQFAASPLYDPKVLAESAHFIGVITCVYKYLQSQ